MKIAVLIDVYGGKFVGGGQVHIQNLVKQLTTNHQVQIKIFSQSSPHIIARMLWSLWVIPLVVIYCLRSRYNILHSHGVSAGIPAKIISWLCHIPVIHTVHGSHLMDLKDQSFKGKLERFILTKIKYDTEISVSRNFLDYTNVNQDIKIITNGVDLPPNIAHRIVSNKIKLLFVGRLHSLKGEALLLKAMSRLIRQYPNLQLRIVGTGGGDYSQMLTKLHLKQYVQFVGKKIGQSLFQEYQNADIFILPSLTEGQPIVILEAMAYALPIITTKVGHNPYMLDQRNGWLCKAGSVSSLRRVINQAIVDKQRWLDIGKYNYHQVQKYYTWDKIATKIYDIYKIFK